MDTTLPSNQSSSETHDTPVAGNPVVPVSASPFTTPPSPESTASPTHTVPPTPPTGTTPPPHTPPPVNQPHKKGIPVGIIILLLILSFLGGLLLAAWYFQTQLQKATTTVTTKTTESRSVPMAKTLVIGTDATFQPMEYTNKEGGLIGYDIDLGYRIGSEFSTKTEIKNIAWDDLFKALDSKQIDMIISAVTITDERKQKYDFSEPYLNAGQVIITRKEVNDITSQDSLKGKRIAVQEGTTNEQEALKYTTPELVFKYPDFVQATNALVQGKADAILSDLPGAKGIIVANPTLKIASDPLTNEYYGVVLRKGDANLTKINEILTGLRVKGILTDLKQKWLD